MNNNEYQQRINELEQECAALKAQIRQLKATNKNNRIETLPPIQEELKQHRDHLDELVKERTLELTNTNARLQHEIAERQRAEESLQKSENLLRTIVNNVPFDLWVCDTEGRYIIQNAISLEIGGNLIGKTVDDLDIPPEVRRDYKARHQRALSGETVRKEDEFMVRGKRSVFDTICIPIWADTQDGTDQQVLGFMGMVIDITERKQVERMLHHRAEEMKALYEISLEMSAELDISALLPSIVRRAATLLGVDMGDLVLVQPDGKTLAVAAVYNRPAKDVGVTAKMGQGATGVVAQTGKPIAISNYNLWAKQTSQVTTDNTIGRLLGVPLKQGEQVIGVLNVFGHQPGDFEKKDIQLLSLFASYTVIALQNARLFEAEHDHRQLAETLSEVAKVTNASLNLSEVLNQVLLSLEKVLPYEVTTISLAEDDQFLIAATSETNENKSLVGAIMPMEKLRFNHYVFTSGRPQLIPDTHHTDYFSPASRDSMLVRSLIGIPLINQGEVIGVVSIGNYKPNAYTMEDAQIAFRFTQQVAMAINNAKLYQQIQNYSQKLEQRVLERTTQLEAAQEQLVRREKLAILGQLAGGVGHELRNPLGVITNAVYFLQMILVDANETVKEYLEIISARVKESEKIVADLLDLSRTHSAQRKVVTVPQLIDIVIERHPPPETIAVNRKLEANLPSLFVDTQQVGQVLVNLVTNAYQAMPNGGTLTFKAQQEQGQVKLLVIDTGQGMSPETAEKVFEPLFTTKVQGIGLGLAVSKNLIEVNGGLLEVASEIGKGTTFVITLPVEE